MEDGLSFPLTSSPDWWLGEWGTLGQAPFSPHWGRCWGFLYTDVGLGFQEDVARPALPCDTQVPVSVSELPFLLAGVVTASVSVSMSVA